MPELNADQVVKVFGSGDVSTVSASKLYAALIALADNRFGVEVDYPGFAAMAQKIGVSLSSASRAEHLLNKRGLIQWLGSGRNRSFRLRGVAGRPSFEK